MKRNDQLYSYFHTKERMEERYGYKELTIQEYKKMCIDCLKGTKIKTEFDPRGYQYIYKMIFKNIEIIVVYKTWRKQISTVLPIIKKDCYRLK